MEYTSAFEDAIWVAKSLFERNKLSGSSGNLSFKEGDSIYITGSGTCFGRLTPLSFAKVSLTGIPENEVHASKELSLHLALYHSDDSVQAVIHMHSFYATLWSCMELLDKRDCVPSYTPYLRIKLGNIPLVPYGLPGSKELFAFFEEAVGVEKGYLLQNHGPIVAGKTIIEAFYGIEELEESARIACKLKNLSIEKLQV